ncbi:hypothetical protein BDR07DRAFT_1261257, partial [Suillus spraguei]
HRRQTSQPRGYEEGTITRVPSGSSSYTNSNALSLHFDASVSMHDHAARPLTGAGGGNTNGPQIVAPTPVVGGPNIVHMWANR